MESAAVGVTDFVTGFHPDLEVLMDGACSFRIVTILKAFNCFCRALADISRMGTRIKLGVMCVGTQPEDSRCDKVRMIL